MNKIQLKVKNKLYEGWETISIRKSMQSIAHSFSMDIFLSEEDDSIASDLDQITNNDLIQIIVDNKPFLTGYLDDHDQEIGSTKMPLKISGRSKAMDLVDCNIESNKQYNNITPLRIIEDLIKPFNITVASNIKLSPLDKFYTKVGETYFNAINRLCKQTNTLPISDSLGNIQIIKNENKIKSTPLTKFKSLKYSKKYNNRYSQYTYKKDSIKTDTTDGKVTDNKIKRFRPFVAINSEDKTNTDMAKWKKTNDMSKSITLTGSITGWDQEINTIVKIESSIVNDSFLIKDIEYIKGNNGTISNITFVEKNLFKDA